MALILFWIALVVEAVLFLGIVLLIWSKGWDERVPLNILSLQTFPLILFIAAAIAKYLST